MADLLGPSAPGVRSQTTFSLQIWMTDDTGQPVQVGTMNNFSPSQRRTNKAIGGVGIGDRRIEIVPGVSSYTLSLEKVAFWDKALSQIFGYPVDVRMLAEMQKPFDIIQQHINPTPAADRPNPNTPDILITVYRKCVISSWDRTQRWGDDVTITDRIDVDVTSIDDGDPSLKSLDVVF